MPELLDVSAAEVARATALLYVDGLRFAAVGPSLPNAAETPEGRKVQERAEAAALESAVLASKKLAAESLADKRAEDNIRVSFKVRQEWDNTRETLEVDEETNQDCPLRVFDQDACLFCGL